MNQKAEKLKKKIMKYSFYFLLLFGLNLQAQNRVSETILPKIEFTFNEYLAMSKISSAG
jgi:hypothetical protein